MNEKIEALARQAAEHAIEYAVNNPELYIPMLMEKFAELIVKECIRYFNEDYQRDFDTLWREDLTKGMKELFGVE